LIGMLSDNEPAPFEIVRPDARSDFLITCDHAGRAIPRMLGDLGVGAQALHTHVASDLHVAELGRLLAERLDALAILHNYSRLVIDVNRPLSSPESMVVHSEHTRVPGNEQLSAEARALRADTLFWPYHQRIADELDRRARAGRATVLVALHTFTPVYLSIARAMQVGVLYGRDARLAHRMLALLRADAALTVGDNQPYAMCDESDYTAVVHGERRGLLHVELEVRQDLLAEVPARTAWAERLAGALEASVSRMFPS
jgi:predicted N-formylglutamate amidohydrolase